MTVFHRVKPDGPVSSECLISSVGDLWGPLANSLALAVTLALSSSASSPAVSAVSLFTLTMSWCWLGGALVAVSLRLLGYRLALLPTLAFLGYALGPLAIAALLSLVLPRWLALIRWAGVGGALVWALAAAVRLLEADPALEDRRVLASYPFLLYYGLLAWIMFIY